MVLKFDVKCALSWYCGLVVVGSAFVGSTAVAQTNDAAEAPFIGFRPFDGSAQTATGPTAPSNSQSQTARPTTIVPERPASAYPYPASSRPAFGVSNSQTGTAERASIGARLPSGSTPTGGINAASGTTGVAGQTAGVAANVDPALWKRYQQEIQQQQYQQQYQQYQQWLAQQQQYQQQRQTSTVGFRTPQQPSSAAPTPAANPAAQPTQATRQDTQINVARAKTPRLNQAVVQQVSSTATSSRDRSVARADFTSVAANSSSNNSTSVAKQATSVAKPQCCCVPQNCCVAATAPTTPAPVFRPQTVNQAANQIPTLTPGAPGSFLAQPGANFQVQPQPGFQFQPGLTAPQFNSTGRNWFSTGLTGTGVYTPLLPIVSAQGARLGQGIIGQPTAYIDGQPVRNLLRYIFP